MSQKEKLMKQPELIAIDNLPADYNHLMLQELLKHYPGVTEMQMVPEKQQALVRFETADEARLALAGLNKFKVEEGRELRATFAA
jgi:hypothetical protein